ncbi:tetratricopeptide repeat protein [Kitasatospora sp. NPDC057223]|uniref:tetratricopeptide repeat protein n=1 Tax=Kitasatospora sp. NPDC057223 TaxID=3346055 RepID=UPI0036434CED
MLDPESHDPEEYEGKTVVIDGCRYDVGEQVGAGASKFVHLLRNRRSGLCLSVLAIYRDPEAGREELKRELAAKSVAGLLGLGVVPNIRQISLPGAPAHLQDYVGPFEAEPSPHLLAAQQLLAEERWAEAVSALSIVLRERPDHTVALNNTAYALARLGRPEHAVELMDHALEVEPNYLPYLRSYIQYADAAGLLAEILYGVSVLREKYPDDHSCDRSAAQVPARAAELNNKAVDLSVAGRRDEAVEAITRTAAAYRLLAVEDPEGYDVELAEVLVNLGNFTRRAGDPVGATAPLVEALVISQEYDHGQLFGIAADSLRHAWAESPAEVAAEFQRLTGDPMPDWLGRRPDPQDRPGGS